MARLTSKAYKTHADSNSITQCYNLRNAV